MDVSQTVHILFRIRFGLHRGRTSPYRDLETRVTRHKYAHDNERAPSVPVFTKEFCNFYQRSIFNLYYSRSLAELGCNDISIFVSDDATLVWDRSSQQ